MSREEKKALRKAHLALRDRLAAHERDDAAAAVQAHLAVLPEYRKAGRLFIYMDMNGELPVGGIIEGAMASGKEVYLPRVESGLAMSFYRYEGKDCLVPGPFGLTEPLPRHMAEPGPGDIMCLPGIAFSKDGFRLGYGAGYYDNYLKGRRTFTIGIAYDFSLLDTLPSENHDQPIDLVIVPSGIHRTQIR